MRRFLVIAAVLCLAAYGAGLWVGSYVQHRRSIVDFKVDIPDGSTVKIYKDQGGDAPFQYDPSKPLLTLSSDREVSMKVGVYDFVVEPDTDYAINVVKKIINNSVSSVVINPDLSQAKLDSKLTSQRNGIMAALFAKFKNAPNYYSVDKVALYKHGEWAGVTLKSKYPEYDPVRFVLNNKNGTWTVVNDPSIMVIGSINPGVPADVITSVNSM